MSKPTHTPSPSSELIKQMRQRAHRTQAQAADVLGVSERQFQRWEAGAQAMPPLVWAAYQRSLGHRYSADFQHAELMTRGLDPDRDQPRHTIEIGDFVLLQPNAGPLIEVRVWLDRQHDGLTDEEAYGGVVIGFPGKPEAGSEFEGFYVGELVTFSRQNILHVEQRVPGRPNA